MTRARKLNEKELGSLYLLTEAPLHCERILQQDNYNESDITSFHDSLRGHAPDLALIAMALSANMLAVAMRKTDNDNLKVLAAELKPLAVNTVEEIGRIWIDACKYGVANDDDVQDMLTETPEILCMLSSIMLEVGEIAAQQFRGIEAIAGCIMYQAEAQADCARSFLENAQDQAPQSSGNAKTDFIPLPPELQSETYTDNIVTFSLFQNKSQPG